MNTLKGNYEQIKSIKTIIDYLNNDDFIKLQESFCKTIHSNEVIHYMNEIDDVCANMSLSSVLGLLDDEFNYEHKFFIKTPKVIKSSDYPTELTPFNLQDFAEFLMDYGDCFSIIENNIDELLDDFTWYAENVIKANKLDINIDHFVSFLTNELTNEVFTEKWEILIIRMLNKYKEN